MATATKVTIVQLLQELIDGMPEVFREGDELKIKSLRDSILKVRALIGSGISSVPTERLSRPVGRLVSRSLLTTSCRFP